MKLRLIFCSLMAFNTIVACAQTDSSKMSAEYFKMGMDVFDFTHRKQSTELFIMATQFDPKNAKAQFMAGKSIILTIQKEASLPYFKRAWKLDPKVDDEVLFYIARGFQYAEQFDSAIFYFEKYNQWLARTMNFDKSIRTTEVNRKIFECRNAKIFKANPVSVKITNLSSKINSEWPDYAPNVSADESIMIFTSRRPEGNINASVAADHEYYEDIYYSTSVNGEWQPAKNIGPPLNTQYHNASVNISPDGKEVFIYSDAHGGDILFSTKGREGWSAPKSLAEINTADIENSASITKDGSRLFFTSNRPGTYGGTDIFTCVKSKSGSWADIKNLGPLVNTEYDEEDVFISANGKHLYFSSNGHAGMGDMDIYRSQYDSLTGSWGAPQNLGYPINSVENDIYFVLSGDERHAYYSSVKQDNKGEQDIYRIDMDKWAPLVLSSYEEGTYRPHVDETVSTPPVIELDIVVIDDETSAPANAKLTFNSGKTVIEPVTKGTGRYSFTWTPALAGSRHELNAVKEGYAPHTSPLYLHVVNPERGKTTVIYDTIRMKKTYVKVGPSEVIHVLFANDSDVPLSDDGIRKVEKILKEKPAIRVEIAGHTDDHGAADYNLELSVRRAEAVKAALVKAGIAPSRIAAAGYGKYKPVADNKTAEGMALNRRTEFTIIE